MEPGVGESAGLEAVRALHKTVVALRLALEESKNEILELKTKSGHSGDPYKEAFRNITLENHILREKIIETNLEDNKQISDTFTQTIEKALEDKEINTENQENVKSGSKQTKKVTIHSPEISNEIRNGKIETKIKIKADCKSPRNITRSLESLTILKSPLQFDKKFSFTKTISFTDVPKVTRDFRFIDEDIENIVMDENNENSRQSSKESDEPLSPQNELDQDQEVDDIELIFTTDETKDSDFKEELISIENVEENVEIHGVNLHLPLSSDIDQNYEISDRELDDDVFNDVIESENQNKSFQSFDLKKENSQIFNSKSDNSINHEERSLKSYYSYQDSSFENKSMEKDESFDRFEERVRIVETDISKCGIHEVEYSGSRRNTCPNPIQYRPLVYRETLASRKKSRPILTHSNAIRKESEAQTDISALPNSSWRSESSLANKARIADNFTTLPSKFPLPGSRLKLSDKTVEARRVLLSDIGFTSMVPELSRSADHLSCPGNMKPPTVTTYGQFLRTTDLYSPGCTNYQSQKFTWTATTATPSESSQTQSRYSSVYPLASPPVPSRRCSAPVSPSRRALMMKSVPSKVRFANGSLPELRSDWNTTVDSGDSTDSLVEEAENFLRRSIDCIVTDRHMTTSSHVSCNVTNRRSVPRRASAPESDGGSVPPSGWQPFLPRAPRDLRLDYWVKVITSEGRVRGGRVRYVGSVAGQADSCVGVQLSTPEGNCDGACAGRRYFLCEPYHGIFVPFRKVIMGWRP